MHLNPWVVIAGIIIVLYFMFIFMSGMSFGGVPRIDNGQYVINNHGQHTVVSEAIYRKAVMSEARSSSGILMAFLYVHFGYFFCKKTRRIPDSVMNTPDGQEIWEKLQ